MVMLGKYPTQLKVPLWKISYHLWIQTHSPMVEAATLQDQQVTFYQVYNNPDTKIFC